MASFQHPTSLNAAQQYRQARAILRKTTRASNPAWYQEALELDFQLHIRADGACIASFFHDVKRALWLPGPPFSEEILHDEPRLHSLTSEALRIARSHGATSLGVILHIADEFATTELKPELDNPAALPDLRLAAITEPASVLSDTSILADQASWRVLPYPAAGSNVIGAAITISKQYEPLVAALREGGEKESFPVITHTVSAPLVTLMGLSDVLHSTPGRPFVVILQYPWFTTLAFFNEHADLRLLRTLQHRGMRRPTNFRNALATTNASLEFLDPDLFLVPLGSTVDHSLEADLRVTFTNVRVETILFPQAEGMPPWCPEPTIAANFHAVSPTRAASHTFTVLREDKWALQNFQPTPREVLEIYPNRTEMRLLKTLRLARLGIAGIAALCILWFGTQIIRVVSQPEWQFDSSQAQAAKARIGKFTAERKKSDHWSNLLEDRSKAWVAMESLARMFPENGAMLVKTYSYSAKPEAAIAQAGAQPKAGFSKEWKITGFARDEAMEYLNNINTREGISAHFNEIARITGNSAYSASTGNRSIVVNVRTQENSGFKPVPPDETSNADDSTYPFTFDLTITQRFEATDPLAILVSKAP